MTDSAEAKADGDNINWEVRISRVVDGLGGNCQALAPNPLVPNPKPRGLGLTLNYSRPPPPPTTHNF